MLFQLGVFGEGSSTKIDIRKKGTLILTSLLEDLVKVALQSRHPVGCFEWLFFLREGQRVGGRVSGAVGDITWA